MKKNTLLKITALLVAALSITMVGCSKTSHSVATNNVPASLPYVAPVDNSGEVLARLGESPAIKDNYVKCKESTDISYKGQLWCKIANGTYLLVESDLAAEKATASLPKGDSTTPLERYEPITNNQIMFKYYALTKKAPDYEGIASLYSNEYAQLNDVFKKTDLLATLKPKIDSEIKAANDHDYFVTSSISVILASYDANTKSFSLDDGIDRRAFGASNWYSFDRDHEYKFAFSNAESFRKMKVADETQARAIEAMRASNSEFILKTYAFAQGVLDNKDKTIQMYITKAVLTDKNGKEIYTFTP